MLGAVLFFEFGAVSVQRSLNTCDHFSGVDINTLKWWTAGSGGGTVGSVSDSSGSTVSAVVVACVSAGVYTISMVTAAVKPGAVMIVAATDIWEVGCRVMEE